MQTVIVCKNVKKMEVTLQHYVIILFIIKQILSKLRKAKLHIDTLWAKFIRRIRKLSEHINEMFKDLNMTKENNLKLTKQYSLKISIYRNK